MNPLMVDSSSPSDKGPGGEMAQLSSMRSRGAGYSSGWLLFAAVMIFIAGFHNLIYGVADLDNYSYVVTNVGTVIYQDLDFWGWLLIALGCVQIIAAFGILSGNRYARWFAIAVAGLNIISQLAFLSVFPVWSIVLIALDVLVIWALTAHSHEFEGAFPGGGAAAGEPYPDDDLAYSERERQRGRADYATARSAAGRPGGGGRHGARAHGSEPERGGGEPGGGYGEKGYGGGTGGTGDTGGTGGTGAGAGYGTGGEGLGTGTGSGGGGPDSGASGGYGSRMPGSEPPRGSEMPPPPPTTGPAG
jgi:hypothetical protein